MTNSTTKVKRSSSVVSSQTYRNMVRQVLEEAPTKALDLHGIYDALGTLYDQYKDDSIEVDWKNSIRHCLSINDMFIRVVPEAILDTFFPGDPKNEFFTKYCKEDNVPPRSYWTTSDIIKELNWTKYILNTGSNIRKAINLGLISDASEVISDSQAGRLRSALRRPNMPVNGKYPIPRQYPVKPSKPVQHVPEWLDPSRFLDIQGSADVPVACDSPMAVDVARQSALFNIAVIEEDERTAAMRRRLERLNLTLPAFGPLKADFITVREEREPIALPFPFKEENSSKESPAMVTLPPIFNHPL